MPDENMGNSPDPAEIGGSWCGYHACQLWQDLWVFEQVLNEGKGLDPPVVGIVELGTAYGGMSLYLLQQARARGLWFQTFDVIDHSKDPVSLLFGAPDTRHPTPDEVFDHYFAKLDALVDGGAPEVVRLLDGSDLVRGGPVVLFCDNGNKPREVALYAEHLQPGSFCVVHDWKTEIGPDDIPDCLYEPEGWGERLDAIGTWSRVFRRV